jgi:flagellar L-ring protein precursor FlgH
MNRRYSSACKATVAAAALACVTLSAGNIFADSLWKHGASTNIAADKKAHAVGDILTVIIQENNGATRQNTTSTSKKNSNASSISSFLYGPTALSWLTRKGTLPNLAYTGDTEFAGTGSINNNETITAQMAVRVIDVLPNGNMVIEGQLRTAFSGEKQDAVVRGTVRSDDISATNSILSYNIADATIQFISRGTVTDATKKGWFTRVWDKVNPF